MWWPQPNWYEAHNAPGTTVTGTRWALAGGEVGGPSGLQTFVLVANTSATAGQARVTIYFEDGTSAQSTINLLANSRTNVSIGETFPSSNGRRFGIVVDSLGGDAGPVGGRARDVLERRRRDLVGRHGRRRDALAVARGSARASAAQHRQPRLLGFRHAPDPRWRRGPARGRSVSPPRRRCDIAPTLSSSRSSDRVVRGRVLDSVVERAPSGAIRTRTRLAVIEDFTGGADTMLDGARARRAPDRRHQPVDSRRAAVRAGRRRRPLPASAPRTAIAPCRWRSRRSGSVVDAAGDRQLTRFGGGWSSSARRPAPRAVEASRPSGRVPAHRGDVDRRRRARRAERGAGGRGRDGGRRRRPRSRQPFTLLGDGLRWREADSGTPIAWYRNTLQPSPVQGADTDDRDSRRAGGVDRSARRVDRAGLRRHAARADRGPGRARTAPPATSASA